MSIPTFVVSFSFPLIQLPKKLEVEAMQVVEIICIGFPLIQLPKKLEESGSRTLALRAL